MVELPGRGGSTYVTDTPGPDPHSPTIVLLHALGCTGLLTWFPSIRPLAKRFRVVTLDLRWHGQGIRSEEFSLADCADDVAALIDLLELDDVIVAGYSMGSIVAQRVWRQHPGQGQRTGPRSDHRPVPAEPGRTCVLHRDGRQHARRPAASRAAVRRSPPPALLTTGSTSIPPTCTSGRCASSARPARGRSVRRWRRSGGITPARGSAGSTCPPRSSSPPRTR